MGSNADGNTAVKWNRDEQCSVVTAFCSCTDCKLCSIGLKRTKTDLSLSRIVLINTLCTESTLASINLWGQGGDGFSVHGDGWGWGSVSVPVQTSTIQSYPFSVNGNTSRSVRASIHSSFLTKSHSYSAS